MSDAVAVALITTAGAVFTAGLGIVIAMVKNLGVKVDGRLTELLELTRTSSKAEGVLEQKENKDR
jgi:hypothetical protein